MSLSNLKGFGEGDPKPEGSRKAGNKRFLKAFGSSIAKGQALAKKSGSTAGPSDINWSKQPKGAQKAHEARTKSFKERGL